MKELQLVSVLLSTPHTESTGSCVIVAFTANFKMCGYMDCQIPSFSYINFIKIGRGHKSAKV